MTTDVFARLMQFEERWNRMVPRFGLVFATVRAITDDGLVLDYLSTTMDAPSTPARLAVPMAGGRRGMYFCPEVGDEVVVGFELGDITRPVVLGSLWNDRDLPPERADVSASNNVRTIVSRAGHQVTLDDTPETGSILIRAQGGYEIKIDAAGLTIKTTGVVQTSRIVLDGVNWGTHIHPTGTGPSGPPQAGSV